ncbi:MAG: hypothetical protein V3T23_11840, partial [Nitrososphaerales archaeon]
NQTDSNTPDCSATTAASIRSSVEVRPKRTPRLGRLIPNLIGRLRIGQTAEYAWLSNYIDHGIS